VGIIERLGLEGVIAIAPRVFRDERGFFTESWNRRAFREATGLDVHFVQDNHSRSVAGVLRGIHYQLEPHAQGKLVRVATGRVWDVAVDLRRGSATFAHWVGVELTDENGKQLWIPPGFGHGFLVLSDSADLLYKTTDYYSPELDRAVRWDDPTLAIEWPIEGMSPILSAKDLGAPTLDEADLFDRA